MSQFDDTTGTDNFDINDLIELTENSGDFEEYLSKAPKADDSLLNKVGESITQGFAASDQVEALATYPGIARSESLNTPNQPIIPTIDTSELPTSIPEAAPETAQVLELRSHPILGNYVAENTVIVGTEEWWSEVFINSMNFGVTSMTPEQIIEMMHRNEEAIRRTKAANQGLRAALEHHLSKMNSGARASLLEKDRQYRAKKVKSDVEKATKVKSSTTKKISGNPLEKTIKTFLNLGMGEAEIVDELTKRGKMDEGVKTLISQLCSQ